MSVWTKATNDRHLHSAANEELERCLALRATLSTTEPSTIAESVENIGRLYGKLGRFEDKVGVLEEAVRLRREVAGEDQKTNVPLLVNSLECLAVSLDKVHRERDALVVAQEAVYLSMGLADNNPAIRLRLQSRLHQLLSSFDRLGGNEAALKATSQCVKLLRLLADHEPISYLPALAASVNNMANLHRKAHNHEHAVDAAEELVGIRRLIAQTNPARLIDVVDALASLAYYQGQIDRWKDALRTIQEKIVAHRDLVRHDPAVHRAGLARALQDIPSYLEKNGRSREAVAAVEEAVQLTRELQSVSPLTRALSTLGWWRYKAGLYKQATEAASEGIELTRTLVVQQPTIHLLQLASDLQRLSYYWSKQRRSKEALPISQEAASIRRTLARDNPVDHLPQLASCLHSIGYYLDNLGRIPESGVAIEECVAIRRNLAVQHPDKYSKPLAMALVNYGWHMHRRGRHGDAYRVRAEAWTLCPEIRLSFWLPFAFDRSCEFLKTVASVPLTPSARRRAAKDVLEKVQARFDEFGDDKAGK